MTNYRRDIKKDTWHFCSNCSEWPTTNYVEQKNPPMTGELCNKCKVKRNEGNCH